MSIGAYRQSYLPTGGYSGLRPGGLPPEEGYAPAPGESQGPGRPEKTDRWSGGNRHGDPNFCYTCDSRRYQDASNDASVSFQTPTKISPEASASAVSAHENEHVVNEKANAAREGGEVVAQSVALFTAICPECKKVYVSGGETKTTVRYGADGKEKQDADAMIGKLLDQSA